MSEEKKKRSADLSNFIDEHLRELRWTSYGLGAVAVLILIGKLKAANKFTSIHQIPSQYITHNYTLQGHVKHVTDTGVLRIEHTPIIEMKWVPSIFSVSKTNDESQHLSVLPAGLEMNPDAASWIKTHASGKHAWFQMFARDDKAVYCDVRIKKGYFGRVSVSDHLIKQGLCKVLDFQSPPEGEYYDKYLKKLVGLEHRAAHQGRGVWREEGSWIRRKSVDLFTRGKDRLKGLFRRDKG